MDSGEDPHRGAAPGRRPLPAPDDPHPFDRLVKIMAILRSEEGCPWDQAQSPASLRPHLLEEAHEVAEAIDSGEGPALREELGDLLFLIVFLAQFAAEQGLFTAREVAEGVARKMIRRHPHVFQDARAETPGQVIMHWENAKAEERRAAGSSILDGLPRGLPALQRAQRLQERAAGLGFDWEKPEDVMAKLAEELEELAEARRTGERAAIRDEVGDLLFAAVNLARQLDTNAEECLGQASEKFRRRFRAVEEAIRQAGGALTPAEMDRVWEATKKKDEEHEERQPREQPPRPSRESQ